MQRRQRHGRLAGRNRQPLILLWRVEGTLQSGMAVIDQRAGQGRPAAVEVANSSGHQSEDFEVYRQPWLDRYR